MKSLQSKLGTGLLLSLIIAFSALWLLVSINIQFLAEDYIASRLKHDTETLLGIIRFDNNTKLDIDTTRLDQIYNQPFSGHYYVINTSKQKLNSRSLWDHKLEFDSVKTGQQLRTLHQGPLQQYLIAISAGYEKQGHQLTITVAEDLNTINKNISLFKYWFAAMAVSMLLVLLVLQIFILRKSLTPLNKVRNELELLQQGQLEYLDKDSPSELQPLINEVNRLHDIMQQRLRRSRDALSDLAHAIKTPLTVLQQITDKDDIPNSTKTALIKQTDYIYQISDRILKRARLAGHSHSGALFSFEDDLPALIKTLDMMYANKNIQLSTTIADNITCSLDRQDMLELLGNLLDNAYKWAELKVNLSVTINTDLHICIEDDGPGAATEKLDVLAKRGVRLDENIQGHGFGLAIAADIINDYNGSLSFTHSDKLGGFKAEITLPLN